MVTPCFRHTSTLLHHRVCLPRRPVLTAIRRENHRSISIAGLLLITRGASLAATTRNNSSSRQLLLLRLQSSKKDQQGGCGRGVSAASSLVSGGLLLSLLLDSEEGSAGEVRCEPVETQTAQGMCECVSECAYSTGQQS